MGPDRHIIYGLTDPMTGHLRYIGKSTKGLWRPRSHVQPWALEKYANTYKGKWVKSLVAIGLAPGIVIIERLDCPEYLYGHEQFWISYFRGMGCPLTNSTHGGAGSPGLKHSAEARLKQSLAKKGKPLSAARRRAVQAMIESNRGRKHSPPRSAEWRAKLGHWKGKVSPTKGMTHGEKARLNNSRAQGGREFVDQNGRTYTTIQGAARELGLPASKICAVLKGRRKSTGGFVFTYREAA